MAIPLLDLVNENDEVVGQISEDESIKMNSKNIRFVNGFIESREGKLWIPLRLANKKMFPNALDFSCGGHVNAGESYRDAFIRESEEELDLKMCDNFEELGKLSPQEHKTNNFMTVYRIFSDAEPNFNREDFQYGMWLYPSEVLEKIASGLDAKSDLPIVIKNFYNLENS